MESDRPVRAEVANLRAALERLAADLSLAEEPSRFQAALEAGAPRPPAGAAPRG